MCRAHNHRGSNALDDLAAPHGAPGSSERRFLITEATHAGINNLPKDLSERIATRLHEGGADLLAAWVDDAVRSQARQTGYGNAFEAIRAHVPWRPMQQDDTGARLNPKPTAPGLQTATVVGPAGERQPSGADEIHTDALGRIKVQLHFQSAEQDARGPDTSLASTWVRVMQRYAGGGMGLQFIPRIGQEVLVGFIEGDIDRPYVMGALYNGKGEAGTPATPGGQATEADRSALAHSTDHAPSAQGNFIGNSPGGHSPAWHGAGAEELDAGG